MRVILLCRDHLDNILFEAEVKSIDDERAVKEECKKYADDMWVDYVIEEDNIKRSWWDHAVSVALAQEYVELRERERKIYGFKVLADTNEIIQDDGWGE